MLGFELLFATLKLTSKNDAVVAALHWIFLNEGCLCVGSGDEAQDGEVGSELLPADWNHNQSLYTLRYVVKSGKIYAVKCIPVDIHLLINFTAMEGEQATAMTINSEDYVDDFTQFQKTYKNLDKLTTSLKSEVVDAVLHPPPPKRSVVPEEPEAASSRSEENFPIVNPMLDLRNPGLDWADVGMADLLPGDLGYGRGGGMLMNPRDLLAHRIPHRGGGAFGFGPALPSSPLFFLRAAVPPGARFDPFGPPMPDRGGRPSANRFGAPDPDHLPPPGYDDMFG